MSPPPPGQQEGPWEEFVGVLRRRPALTIFLFGLVLFLGGLFSVIGSSISGAARNLPGGDGEATPTAPGGGGRVGPTFGEAVGPYIEKERSTLTERARSAPRDPTLALVVFKEYRTAESVEAFLGARKLSPLTAQVRVPVRSFKPQEVALESRSLGEAAEAMRDTVSEELEVLEEIAAGVDDPAYKAVYEKDIALHREALARLTTSPATIFAVVVRSTHGDLASIARAPEVRFVDLPDEPTATLEDTTFAAVIPEDIETATFAVQ
jgi:hypothetical protein